MLYSARDMYVVIVVIIVIEPTPTQTFRTYGLGSDAPSRAVMYTRYLATFTPPMTVILSCVGRIALRAA